MDKIKMRINFLLSDSNMKIDFLRGRPRCRHSQHAQNPKAIDSGEMERGIHVKILTDKLVKGEMCACMGCGAHTEFPSTSYLQEASN